MKTQNRDNYAVFPTYNKEVVIIHSFFTLTDNYNQVFTTAHFLIHSFHYHFSFPVVHVV